MLPAGHAIFRNLAVLTACPLALGLWRFLVFDQRDKLWPKLLNPDAPTCTWYPDIDQIAFEIFE